VDEERTHRISQWIADELARIECVRRAVLFGSRARGDNRERSDIDVAIEAPEATAGEWSDIVETVDSAPTLLRLDVVRLERTPAALRKEIERDGKEIYSRESSAA